MATTSTLVIAHRGASADFAENTIAAFEGASAQRADGVELDVRLTADGALVVNHDPYYSDGRPVWTTPAAQRPASVPDLSAALDACRGVINVEIKNMPGDLGPDDSPYGTDVVDAVAELLSSRRASGVEERILISSFDEPSLVHLGNHHPDFDRALLGYDVSSDAVAAALDAGYVALHPWEAVVDDAAVERCGLVGMVLNVWTVDDPARIEQFGRMGVNGVVTNVPAVALAALERG